MSGRAELCGRMTNDPFALLGSEFWEEGQPAEPFIHFAVSDSASRVWGGRASRGVKATGSRAHCWQMPPGGMWARASHGRPVGPNSQG